MKKISFLVMILIPLFLIILGVQKCTKILNKGMKEMQESLKDALPDSKTLTEEYSTVIKSKYRNKTLIDVVRNNKIRNPIAVLEYDKDYAVFLYKISLSKDSSLQQLIFFQENQSAKEKIGVTYSHIDVGTYFFINKSRPVSTVDSIYFNYSGTDIIKGPANDSIASYTLMSDNISIKYKSDEMEDIIIKENNALSGKEPFEFLFLKRRSAVFFLAIVTKNLERTVPVNILYKMVTNQ